VIDLFVEKYRSQGEATILENAWKFPPSDLQAKMIAACINYPLFDRASSARNLTLLINDVGGRKAIDGAPVIRRLLPKNQTLDSFRNAIRSVINNPALFDKNHENHGQSFREFYSLLRTTQFFLDAIDRPDIKEISFGKYTWKWQKNLNDEQRTEGLLDTILKFCSNGNENPTQEDYEKAGKFTEKFFLNQNCSGNNNAISYTALATIDTKIEKNVALYFLAFNNILNISEARKMLLTVTENNELISTEYYYFDKNDSLLQEVLQKNSGYQQLLEQYSKDFSPDEYPHANGSFMIFCRTTRIDLNQENPEEIDINNDENSSIFLTLGTP
nr:hypothetical protein [Opitutales bacterium]